MAATREQWTEVIKLQKLGVWILHANVAIFRKLLCSGSPTKISSLAGRNVRLALGLIKFLSAAPTLFFLISSALAIGAFRWWALLVIPATGILVFGYLGYASSGHQSLMPVSLLFAGTVVAGAILGQARLWLAGFVVAVGAALLLSRLLYFVTSRFVFRLCEESYSFFNEFYLEPPGAENSVLWAEPLF